MQLSYCTYYGELAGGDLPQNMETIEAYDVFKKRI